MRRNACSLFLFRGAPSGPYYIKVKDTNLPGNMQEVYCIMRRSGYCPAGITQILKIDGRQVGWYGQVWQRLESLSQLVLYK